MPQRIDEGVTCGETLVKMLKERAKCEDAYANALRGWAKTWHDKIPGALMHLHLYSLSLCTIDVLCSRYSNKNPKGPHSIGAKNSSIKKCMENFKAKGPSGPRYVQHCCSVKMLCSTD